MIVNQLIVLNESDQVDVVKAESSADCFKIELRDGLTFGPLLQINASARQMLAIAQAIRAIVPETDQKAA